MKLFWSSASPYVRKVMVCAFELGLEGRIERLTASAHPVNRNAEIISVNPLGKVPTLIDDSGMALYDSRVICEYLDAQAGGGRLFPKDGAARWRALTEQALADGLLDAALLARYEGTARPEAMRWTGWSEAQLSKVDDALRVMESQAGAFADRFDIGTISIACALGYLDLRFADIKWRDTCPALARWLETISSKPAFRDTAPKS